MKSLYISAEHLHKSSGISQKISRTLEIWKSWGLEPVLFNVQSGKTYEGDNLLDQIPEEGATKDISLPRWKLPFFLNKQFKLALEFAETFKPDFIYTRELIYTPAMVRLIRTYPSFMELNSIMANELRNNSVWAFLYYQLTSALVLKPLVGVVSVGSEILRSHPGVSHKQIVIPNGIDIKPLELAPRFQKRPQILFICNGYKAWYGIDIILEYAKHSPDFDFHFVGLEGASTDNVQYHGFQSRLFIEELAVTMTVAISTLAMYRKNMEENGTLKTRLYLERGIPTIYGCIDPDISDDCSFALRVPNCESSLMQSKARVDDFIHTAHNNLSLRNEARLFAETKLAQVERERERLLFIKERLNI